MFMGQAFAAVQPTCAPMDSHPDPRSDIAVVGEHGMPDCAGQVEMTDTGDCCGNTPCSSNHCVVTAFALLSTHPQPEPQSADTPDTEYSVSYLIPDTSIPFRPPISR